MGSRITRAANFQLAAPLQCACVCAADTRFTRPTDEQINATLRDTTRRVGVAVNRTRDDLRSGARTAEHLLKFVRYPPSHARNLARSAEIFEQTMQALLADVNAGHSYNISTDTGQCTNPYQYRLIL